MGVLNAHTEASSPCPLRNPAQSWPVSSSHFSELPANTILTIPSSLAPTSLPAVAFRMGQEILRAKSPPGHQSPGGRTPGNRDVGQSCTCFPINNYLQFIDLSITPGLSSSLAKMPLLTLILTYRGGGWVREEPKQIQELGASEGQGV